jgi:hypothetical protein
VKPSIGRIVIVRHASVWGQANGADAYPAIITRVHSDECINVVAFVDGVAAVARTSLVLGTAPGQWHWPELVRP